MIAEAAEAAASGTGKEEQPPRVRDLFPEQTRRGLVARISGGTGTPRLFSVRRINDACGRMILKTSPRNFQENARNSRIYIYIRIYFSLSSLRFDRFCFESFRCNSVFLTIQRIVRTFIYRVLRKNQASEYLLN